MIDEVLVLVLRVVFFIWFFRLYRDDGLVLVGEYLDLRGGIEIEGLGELESEFCLVKEE